MKMNNLIPFVPQDSNLSIPTGVHSFIKSQAGGFDQLPYLKVLSGMNEEIKDKSLGVAPGELLLCPDNIGLGESCPVIIGPWRIKAMTIENGKVTRTDFNLTPNARYVWEKNDWEFPDGLTPICKEIGEGPSDGSSLLNAVGYDILFYIPKYKIGAVLWLKGTALTMSKIFAVAKANLGQYANLTVKEAKSSKFSWYLPHLYQATPPEGIEVDPSFLNTIKTFLNPGVMSVENESEKPR